MILCPQCQSKTRVINTVMSVRQRICLSCKFTGMTEEVWKEDVSKSKPKLPAKPKLLDLVLAHPLWPSLTNNEQEVLQLYLDPARRVVGLPAGHRPVGTAAWAKQLLQKLELPDDPTA